MTRYANRPRNADILAAFFTLHLPPKQIVRELKARHPDITIKIVYKVVELHVKRFGEIRGNRSVDNTESTA